MRKAIAAMTGLLIMAAWAATAQEPKAKSGHETMPTSGGGRSDAAKIARAMSAAPPEISRTATIMDVGADGKMKQLRAGTNAWMCMTEPNGVPMCLDKEWQGWADAWINKKDPQIRNVGVAYMLAKPGDVLRITSFASGSSTYHRPRSSSSSSCPGRHTTRPRKKRACSDSDSMMRSTVLVS